LTRHFLLTREKDEHGALGAFLKKNGYALSVVPLLIPQYLPLNAAERQAIEAATDIVITSRRALMDETLPRKPLWCVGTPPPGWPIAGSAPTVAALQQLLDALPAARRLVYLRGREITTPLHHPHVTSIITYAMDEAAAITLPHHDFWGAAVFSNRSLALLTQRILPFCRIQHLFTLMPDAAPHHPHSVTLHSAKNPSLAGLIACIENVHSRDTHQHGH
jgi:hypothetical protein